MTQEQQLNLALKWVEEVLSTKKRNLYAQAAAMNLQNGWEDVQVAGNGIRWSKK